MKKTYFLFFITSFIYSQNKKDWFVGLELGSNTIISYKFNEPKTSIQEGLTFEYYFNKYISASTRVKYFKTGLSYSNGSFNGTVISAPLNVNISLIRKSKLYPKFHIGFAYNYETESNYNFLKEYPKSYVSINIGAGVNYKLTEKLIIYSNIEGYFFGGFKGNNGGFILLKNSYTENIHFNIGIKQKINL
jgi:hypothetical protein